MVPGTVIGMVAAVLALVAAILVAAPRGTSLDVLPILALLVAFPVSAGTGMLYSRHLHQHRDHLYAAWLRRR